MTGTERGGGGTTSGVESDLYVAALLRDALEAASESNYSDDPLAHARRQVGHAFQRSPNDAAVLLRAADILVRAAAVHRDMGMQSKRRLAANMDRLMEEVHDLMRYPPPRTDEEHRAMLARMREEPSPGETQP